MQICSKKEAESEKTDKMKLLFPSVIDISQEANIEVNQIFQENFCVSSGKKSNVCIFGGKCFIQ